MIGYVTFYREPDDDLIVFEDLAEGLILTTWAITPPKPRFNMVTVPGRHGSIDYTDFYGEAILNRGTVKMTFAAKDGEHITSLSSRIMGAIHGKNLYFRNSRQQEGRYYNGRVFCSAWQRKNGIVYYTVTAEVEPYMYGPRIEGEFTVTATGASLQNVDIESPGDVNSTCEITSVSGAALHVFAANGTVLETVQINKSRLFSAIMAGNPKYRNLCAAGLSAASTVNYAFFPRYYFDCGV